MLRQKPISGISLSRIPGPLRHPNAGKRDSRRRLGSNLFSEDDYLRGRQAKSILCLPLIKQARLTGLLYLENKLTSHAFTPARIAVLELLASQAAISLENTRLYSDLQEREARSAAWSTPTSSGYASGMLKVESSRPTKPISTWWDTAAKISFRVACAGRR